MPKEFWQIGFTEISGFHNETAWRYWKDFSINILFLKLY